MNDEPVILNRAPTPRPPPRPEIGPWRAVQQTFAALTSRFDRVDARFAKLETDMERVLEQIDARGRSFVFASAWHALMEGRIDFATDTFGLMLAVDRYVPDERNHRLRADV